MDVLNWVWEHIIQIIVVLGVFFEITPIKFNPITSILNFLFKPIRTDMNDMKKELKVDIDNVKIELKKEIEQIKIEQEKEKDSINKLIEANDYAEISRISWEIKEFSNSIENKQLHLRDEYRHIKDDFRKFNSLIEKYDLNDDVAFEDMEKINAHYDEFKNSTSIYI
jgi:hypothetical protein